MKLIEISDDDIGDRLERVDPYSKEAGELLDKYVQSVRVPVSKKEFDILNTAFLIDKLSQPALSKYYFFTDLLSITDQSLDVDDDEFDAVFKANPNYYMK